MKTQDIQNQLFTWEYCDEQVTLVDAFYNAVLVRDIGPFKKGDKFPQAYIDWNKYVIVLYKDVEGIDGHVIRFQLEPTYVGPELPS